MSQKLRKKILKSSFLAGACHIGSALSCVEIVNAVYETKRKEDIFLFAKASGVCTLYCKLYPKKATRLIKKYPLPSKDAGLIWSGGSLGQGLSVACGMALANKSRRIYVLISDGELQEGQTWEAIMFANHHKLANLTVIIDNNSFQALGKTKDICDLGDIKSKFESFGWYAIEVDGHSMIALNCALGGLANRPKVIIANTIKGKGVNFMENNNDWHYKNLDEKRYKKAIFCLDKK